jgi:hypothetical protein
MVPGGLVFAPGNVPVAITPQPQGAEAPALCFMLDGPQAPLRIHAMVAGGVGDFAPHAIDYPPLWRCLKDRALPRLALLVDFPPQTIARRQRHHLAPRLLQPRLQGPQTQAQTIPPKVMIEQWTPAALIAPKGLPRECPGAPSQRGHPQVRTPPLRRQELSAIRATTRPRRATAPGQGFVPGSAQILGPLFLQAVLQDTLDRGRDGVLPLLAHGAFEIAWKPPAVDHLQGVMQGAAMMPRRGMAHRDSLS